MRSTRIRRSRPPRSSSVCRCRRRPLRAHGRYRHRGEPERDQGGVLEHGTERRRNIRSDRTRAEPHRARASRPARAGGAENTRRRARRHPQDARRCRGREAREGTGRYAVRATAEGREPRPDRGGREGEGRTGERHRPQRDQPRRQARRRNVQGRASRGRQAGQRRGRSRRQRVRTGGADRRQGCDPAKLDAKTREAARNQIAQGYSATRRCAVSSTVLRKSARSSRAEDRLQ